RSKDAASCWRNSAIVCACSAASVFTMGRRSFPLVFLEPFLKGGFTNHSSVAGPRNCARCAALCRHRMGASAEAKNPLGSCSSLACALMITPFLKVLLTYPAPPTYRKFKRYFSNDHGSFRRGIPPVHSRGTCLNFSSAVAVKRSV